MSPDTLGWLARLWCAAWSITASATSSSALIAELDLQNTAATEAFFAAERPEYVFLAAAKVGGIQANNTYPADFIRNNLQIQTNILEAARQNGVQRLLFLGSSCIYPRDCPQPVREEYRPTDQPSGFERHHRSRPRGRSRQGLCRGCQ